jgi:hypothetical protein
MATGEYNWAGYELEIKGNELHYIDGPIYNKNINKQI